MSRRSPALFRLCCAAFVITGAGCSPQIDSVVPKKDGGYIGDQGVTSTPDGGAAGDMARAWTDVSVSTTNNFWTIWNSGSGTVLAAGDLSMVYKSLAGGAFVADKSAKPTNMPNLLSIGAILPGPPTKPLYIVGQQGTVWSYTGDLAGGTGTFAAETIAATGGIYGVWVAADGTAWAVGDAVAFKRAGGTWTALTGIPSGSAAYNLWGIQTATSYSLYAVGSNGQIWHSTGGNFIAETSGTTSALYGVWGSSADDIYAVGDVGTVLHSTGNGAWTVQNTGVTVPLEGITGASANEIYAVGDNGTLLAKYDPVSVVWYAEDFPGSAQKRTINGGFATPFAVYLVGNAGLILKK